MNRRPRSEFSKATKVQAKDVCAVSGCERPSRGNTPHGRVCGMHCQRWAKYGSFELPNRKATPDGICAALGCVRATRTVNAEYCETHYYRLRRGSGAGLGPIHKKCVYCGSSLSHNQSRFCSALCQTRHHRQVPATKECAVCHREFSRNGRTVTCSPECAQRREEEWRATTYKNMMSDPKKRALLQGREHRRRAAKSGVDAEHICPNEIFERDGWACQLCGGHIWRHVKWPHPKSPTLDHIVPLSRGGPHNRKNVQCAHLRCNIKKSNGDGGQLRLFG